MPYLSKSVCNYDRCSNIVGHGKRYCENHTNQKSENTKKSHRWYHIPAYRRARNRFVKDNPECAECGEIIQNIADRHLDHKVPFQTGDTEAEQWQLFWDHSNWQVLDPQCHQRKTVKEMDSKKEGGVVLVFGPPFGGKTTHVIKQKEPDDIMVDMDLLYQSITGNEKYQKPASLYNVVVMMRDSLYDYASRNPKAHKYWIITTESETDSRKKLMSRFRADSIIIDPGKETCLKRMKESDRPERGWKELINKWYDSFESQKGERIIR